MAEDKKPKIDLKARLGKVQSSGVPGAISSSPSGRIPSAIPPQVGGSVPPPAVIGSPIGSVPPPAVGVPIPPFGGQPQTDAFGARVDPRSSRAAGPGAGATIKVEMDAETARAAGKAGKKAAMLGVLGIALGLGLGWAFGERRADSKGAERAVQDAHELIGDVEKAQEKVKELTGKIGEAVKSLKEKKFPESFSKDLGGLSVPFGADKLAGRNIGRFKAMTLQMLLDYTVDIEALNDRKDALRNVFAAAKQPITDALASADNPKVAWSVFVQKSPTHGSVAVLARNDPAGLFAYKDNWPDKYKISTGNELVEVDHYARGDVFTSDNRSVKAIPLEPDSVSSAFPNDALTRITAELLKTETVLSGGGDEGDQIGIYKKGENLLAELRKIGK
jgi:hypothetical protein